MSKIKKLFHSLLYDRNKIKLVLLYKFSRFYSDESFIRKLYLLRMGKELNLDNPQTFNEKLQWLKLYNRKPEYTQMVDKYEAKKYVAKIIGEEYIIPTLGVWDRVEDIDWDSLPNQFVIKTTHGGGNTGVIICNDKSIFDIDKAKIKLREAALQSIYSTSREWSYKNIKPRFIAEQLLNDEKYGELRDYKFFCFDGAVKALFIATGRQTNSEPFFNYYDENGSEIDIKQTHPKNPSLPELPSHFKEMKDLASKLSQGIPHIRVDFYEVNGRVYFGELTFFHHAGLVPFHPEKWDYIFGSWITLPKKV